MSTELIQFLSITIGPLVALFVLVQSNRSKAEYERQITETKEQFVAATAQTKSETDRRQADIEADLAQTKERALLLNTVIKRHDTDMSRMEDWMKRQAANDATINAFSKMTAHYTAAVEKNTGVTEDLKIAIESFGKLVQGMWDNLGKVSTNIQETGDQVVSAGKQIMQNSDARAAEIITKLDEIKATVDDIDERLKRLETKPDPIPPPPIPPITLSVIPPASVKIEETKKVEDQS